MTFLEALKHDMRIETELLQAFEKSTLLQERGRLNCKTIRGNPEFYEILEDECAKHISPNKWERIVDLRTKGFINKTIKILKKNLKLQKKLLESYQSYDLQDIEKKLVNAYNEEVVLFDKEGTEHVFYVDFIIMTPSGKYLYWEHLGLLDQKVYREKNFEKIKVFFDNGIFLGDNLIITMESERQGLHIEDINRVIRGQVLLHFEESVSYNHQKNNQKW